MKKRSAMVISVVLIVLVLFSAFVVLQSYSLTEKPFHVGVTYGGNSVDEAKQLIDKVKNYTNLFILASGSMQDNQMSSIEICDYAVNNGLDIIVYYGSLSWRRDAVSGFLNVTKDRWGNHFLGLYYGDEPGGKMLDVPPTLSEAKDDSTTVSFLPTGEIKIYETNMYVKGVNYTEASQMYNVITTYYPNGTIVETHDRPSDSLIFQPDGTTTLRKLDGSTSKVTDYGNISKFEPYQQLWNSRPLKNYDETAAYFVKENADGTNWLHNQSMVKAFTSDYGLYWFDYLGGYDVVLAEFGWNHTDIQHMGLVRGAANLQGKSWGAMLTWKSDKAPYLASGEEMYNQMALAFNGGAEYVAVFNYSPKGDGVGLLQDEHYKALERFWNEHVVPNNGKAQNVKAEASLILPKNYGWGMRNPDDTVWGFWKADANSTQVWSTLQEALKKYGEKLDIVYDDSTYQVAGRYSQNLFWNQTG
jgi:hypothetical protein